jgi:putative addiction module component (TIGR02574 family)
MNNPKESAALPKPLVSSDDFPVDAAWEVEISRRVREVKSGEVQLISSEEVYREARKLFAKNSATDILKWRLGNMIDISRLSRDERIELMSRIWQSLAAEPEKIALTPQQKEVLDQRLAKFDENGSIGIPAADVFEKLRANRAWKAQT